MAGFQGRCAGRRSSTRGSSGRGPASTRTSALDPKTGALLQAGASAAIGSSAVCMQWRAARAPPAGATKDEIADVLLAIPPVAGMGLLV